MKSEAEVQALRSAKAILLPPDGAEFDISYFAGEEEVVYGSEPHTWANAVSPGLKVIVIGKDSRLAQRRQKQPSLGKERNMLRVHLGDVWVHVFGDLIVVAHNKLNVGQIVQAERGG